MLSLSTKIVFENGKNTLVLWRTSSTSKLASDAGDLGEQPNISCRFFCIMIIRLYIWISFWRCLTLAFSRHQIVFVPVMQLHRISSRRKKLQPHREALLDDVQESMMIYSAAVWVVLRCSQYTLSLLCTYSVCIIIIIIPVYIYIIHKAESTICDTPSPGTYARVVHSITGTVEYSLLYKQSIIKICCTQQILSMIW